MKDLIPASVLVLGATGMTGRKLVGHLLASSHVGTVHIVGRRSAGEEERKGWTHPEKLKESIVNMDKLDDSEQVFSGHSIAYCCLGTTRAQAGSAEEFVRIDKDIPLQAARLFHKGETQTTQSDKNLQHFVLLSSTGSNASSWFLYPKTKGELEQQIIGMGFNRVSIVRPGLLDYRPDQRPTRRIMEEWMMPILDVVAPRSAILGVTQLGKAMCKMGEQWLDEFSKNNDTLSKVQVYENNDILNLAEQE